MAENRILITDDDQGICETLSDIFQDKGYGVATANTGGEAADKAGQTAFDVALIDIRLPDMDGIDLIGRLKKMDPHMGVIIITGHASVKSAAQAMGKGALGYVVKPLNMDELLATVREVLEKRRLAVENRSLLQEIQRELAKSKKAEEQISRQSRVLEAINTVFREALICETDKEVAETCLTVAEEISDSKFGFIGELNQAGSFDTIAISNPGWDACKMPDSEATRLIKNMETRGIDRSLIREGKSRIVNDPASHPDRVGTPEGHPPVISFLGVPLKHTGKTIGMIGLANKESGYDLADQQAIETLSVAFVEALMRKRGELALDREREKFRILVEESPLGVSITGKDGECKYINSKTIEMFGYNLEDIPTGREWFQKAFPDPEYRKQATATWISDLKKYKRGELHPRSFTVTCKDGAEKIVRFFSVPMKTGDQLVIYEDITEHKLAEAVLLEYERAVEASKDLIAVVDREYKYKLVNKAFLAQRRTRKDLVIGHHAEEIIGKKVFEEIVKPHLDKCFDGETVVYEMKYEYPEIGLRDLEVSYFPLKTREREVGSVVSVLRDITEKRRLEAQFLQSQKMEGIGRLAGGVAHDFNNLLTTIIGYADIMLTQVDKESPFRTGMEEIKLASDRAASLTGQLLAFSRKQMIHPVVLDLNYPLAEMDKMLRRLIGDDIDLVTVLEPELWKVKFDPGQMDQVLINLAVNAKDAMSGGGKLTIETANVDLDEAYARRHGVEMKPGPFVMLAVSDTGMGMDEETRSHIFEPFFTTKEKGKGTGLGLSTVYGIVKQSEGFIWVYSEPGQGTTFKIYLPKAEAGEAFREEKQTQAQNLEGSETILLAEDDDSARKLIRSVLQEHGYRVLEAQDGEEALQLFEQHEGLIHLLLTDVVMPGMNGRELAERLHPLQPKMKVLYMSGYTDNAIIRNGVLEPGMPFIQKPFPPEVLVSECRKVLDC